MILNLLFRILQAVTTLGSHYIRINERLDRIERNLNIVADTVETVNGKVTQAISKLNDLKTLGSAQTETLGSVADVLELLSVKLNDIHESVVLPPASMLRLSAITIGGDFIPEGASYMPKLHKGESYTLTVAPKNAAGLPARIDGLPAWKAEPADLVALVVSEDGLTATITANDAPGSDLLPFVVSATADSDLGDGVRAIVAAGSGFIIPEGIEATVLDLVEGPVVPAPTV